MKHLFRVLFFFILINSVNQLYAKVNSSYLEIETVLASPTATISGNATVCLGSTSPIITFTGSGGTAPYTFTYKINGGAEVISVPSTGDIYTVNVPTGVAGPFVYTLVSVKDSKNATQVQTETATVTVNALPSISGNLSTCISSISNLSGSGTANGTMPWISSNPSVAIVNGSGLVTGVAAGTTNITYTDTNGCAKTVVFTVNAQPTVNFTFTNNQCSGNSIQFTSTVTGVLPLFYLWDFGDGNTSSQTNPIHTFNAVGNSNQNFNIKLTVTSSNPGCLGSVTKIITIIQAPDSALDTSNSSGGAYYDTTQNIFLNCGATSTSPNFDFVAINTSSTISTNTSYKINWGDGSPDYVSNSFNSQTHTYLTLGYFDITVTSYKSGNTCSSSTLYKFFNGNAPAGNLDLTGNSSDCAPYTYTWPITPVTFTNPPGTTYLFSVNDGSAPQIFTQSTLPTSISHTFTKSSCGLTDDKFTVTFKIENSCNSNSPTTQVQAREKPIAKFDISPSDKVCTNTIVSFSNKSVGSYGNSCNTSYNKTWTILPITGWTVSSGSLNGTDILNVNFNTPGNYSIKLNIQQPGASTGTRCTNDFITKAICVESPPIPTFTLNNNSVCSPQSISATNTTDISNSCIPPTYIWSVTHAPSSCGASIATISNQYTTNASFNFVEPGTYTITLNAINSCGSFPSSQTVTIKKPPTVLINSIPDFCGATSISPVAVVNDCAPASSSLTYAWSFPGGSPATSSVASPSPISYASTGNYTVSLTVTNECGISTIATETFAIKEAPLITNTTLSQTICSGSSTTLVNLTSNPIGATYSWTATATSGITGFFPSGTTNTIPLQTISTTSLSSGTVTYAITPSIGLCSGAVVNYVITVNPAPTITNQPASSTVCQNGTLAPLTVVLSGVTGTPTYQWYSNTGNNTTTGIIISGETNASFTPPSSTVGTIYYYCVITLPSGGCSNLTSTTATITISPIISIGTQPTPTQSLCVGTTIATPLTINYSGGTGTPSYQWYSNTTNSNTSGSPIASATTPTYTPLVFSILGNYYYYATVSLNGTGCLPATSNAAEVIVYADPTVSSQSLVSQTLCQGASPQILQVTATGGIGTFSYQWFSNTSNSNLGGTLISGANTDAFLPPTTIVGTMYYYCLISQSTLGCSVTCATAAVIVNAAPTITNQPVSSSVCLGGIPTILSVVYTNGVGIPSYQWYSNSINSNSGGTLISSATNSTFNPPNSPVVTTFYYCIISLPATGGCSSIISTTANVTINAGATISTQPTPTQSLCVGTTIATPLTINYSGGTGTPSYQWYSNNTNSNTSGNIISGATSLTFTPPPFTTTGNYYYYALITLSGNGCGPILSDPAEVVIVADPVVSAQPLPSQTVCQSATTSDLVVVASGGIGTTYSYQWFSNTTNITTSGAIISGAITATYSPPTTAVGTVYYYCVITQSAGSGCNITSNTTSVIVNLAPTFTSQPSSSIVCVGQTPTHLSVSYINGVGTPQYQWYSNIANDTINGILISGATNPTYPPPAIATGTIYYYCDITLSTGGCSNLTSNTATVTINPNPVISNKSSVICSGKSFTVTPDSLGGDIVPIGTTYTWTNPSISPAGSINGASAAGIPQTNISQTLINTTTNPSTVTYTITPTSGACIGNNFSVVVTVNPSINPNSVVKNSTCFGVNNGNIQTIISGGIPFSSGNPYTISWSGTNGFTATTANISNLAPGDYTLSVLDNGGCPFSKIYTVTEPADILITTDLEKDISCFGNSNGAIQITVTGGTPVYRYAWTKNGTAFANTKNLSTLNPGIYEVTVSDMNNCGPKTASFTITEPPILAVNLVNKTDLLCFGTATGTINVTITGGTSPYTYLWTSSNGFTSSNQNLINIFAGTYNLTVTDASACSKNLSVTLTQNAEISINAVITPIICYGANDGSINLTISGGIVPYTILWSNLGSGLFQNNLSAGDYLITVTDALGCPKTLNVNIPEPPIFTINPVVKNISCFGAHNGSINLNIIGGIAAVVLKWDDNATAGNVRNNLGPGSYTVTITDSKPCVIKQTFIIQEPQLLVLSANLTPALDCDNANSGAINLLVSGGSAPFTYAWSNGTTTEDLTNIPAGNYLVTVTDARACSKTAQYSINRPPPIVIGVETKTDFNCDTKYVKQTFVAQVTGGVPPYQLNWSSGTISGTNNEIMNTNQNGMVILDVTDNLGCKANYTFNVSVPKLGNPSFSSGSYAYTAYGVFSIMDPIQFSNAASGDFISVSWDFGDGTVSNEVNPIHTFVKEGSYVVTQTVTYPLGCVYKYIVTMTVTKGYELIVPNGFTPNGDGINDNFRPVFKGLKSLRLDVYDTWGELIYSEEGETLRGWNGKIKDKESENGNYYYKVTTITFYGTTINEHGPFVLIK